MVSVTVMLIQDVHQMFPALQDTTLQTYNIPGHPTDITDLHTSDKIPVHPTDIITDLHTLLDKIPGHPTDIIIIYTHY